MIYLKNCSNFSSTYSSTCWCDGYI